MSSSQQDSNARRHVLILLPTLNGGGAERIVVTLLRHLDRKRFRPTLAVVDLRNANFLSDVPGDVEVVNLDCSRVLHALPRILRLLWSRRPDVVFSTLGHLNLAIATLRPFMPPAPTYIARETGIVSDVNATYRHTWLWNWAYRRFYRRFDRVICQSAAMQEDLVDRHRVPVAKTVVIPNPTDVERVRSLAELSPSPGFETNPARPSAGRLKLLSVGRMSSEKGFDLAVDALALCGHPDVEWTFVGDGPLRREVEDHARHLGVLRKIVFAGFQPNPYPYYRRAHAMVLCSRSEGFPNVVLEALTCGTPVISTPVPSVVELLDGIQGCAVAKAITAEAVAAEIARFVPGERVNEGAVQPYQVATIVQRYEAIFG